MRRKILIIKRTLGGGGAEKLLIDTLGRIDYSQYDVSLMTNDPKGFYFKQIDPHVRLLVFRDIFGSFLLRNLFYYIPFLRKPIMSLNRRRAQRAAGNDRYDVAVSYLEGHSASVHLGLLDLANRNVTWIHTDMLDNPWSRRYYASPREEREFYRKVDEIVFVSDNAGNQFDRYIPVHAKTRVLYNMVNTEQIVQRASADVVAKAGPVLVAVGRLVPQKRFDRLIRAFAIIREKRPDVTLWILGDGKLKKELELLCKDIHLMDAVQFLGFVPNPYPYVKAADVFVSSSDTEGYSLVVAEAMCLGKAIVATAVTGPTELLANQAGILVPLDEQSLAEACLRLLEDDVARKELGNHALEEAKRKFDVSSYMSGFYAVLEGRD